MKNLVLNAVVFFCFSISLSYGHETIKKGREVHHVRHFEPLVLSEKGNVAGLLTGELVFWKKAIKKTIFSGYHSNTNFCLQTVVSSPNRDYFNLCNRNTYDSDFIVLDDFSFKKYFNNPPWPFTYNSDGATWMDGLKSFNFRNFIADFKSGKRTKVIDYTNDYSSLSKCKRGTVSVMLSPSKKKILAECYNSSSESALELIDLSTKTSSWLMNFNKIADGFTRLFWPEEGVIYIQSGKFSGDGFSWKTDLSQITLATKDIKTIFSYYTPPVNLNLDFSKDGKWLIADDRGYLADPPMLIDLSTMDRYELTGSKYVSFGGDGNSMECDRLTGDVLT